MLILKESTRQTNHLEATVLVIDKTRPAQLGKDITFRHYIHYQMRGYQPQDVAMYTIYYLDGMVLGPICCAKKEVGSKIILEHVSLCGQGFSMLFTNEQR